MATHHLKLIKQMDDSHIKTFISNMETARAAILKDLESRHESGDTSVTMNKKTKSVHDDLNGYLSGNGKIQCPVCKTGELRYSRAAYNGHVHAGCSTDGCVRWME